MKNRNRSAVAHAAFTMTELLVVISIIAILASLLLPVLSRAKDKGRQTFCRNNLKQMGIAFTMYHGDNMEEFPAPGSKGTYGPQPEDWIWWQYGRGVTNSVIVPFIGGFDPSVFTCPTDTAAKDLQSQGFILNDPYRFSYSLTSYDLTNTSKTVGVTNLANRGLATIVTQAREAYPYYAQSIKNPAGKIMLVEEDRTTLDDPRWISWARSPGLIAERHGKKGNVLFCDGHIESVPQKFGRNPTNSEPSF